MSVMNSKNRISNCDYEGKNEESSCIEASSNTIILYRKRYLILFLFILFSFTNAYQWIHLNIISDRVSFFWNNSLPSSSFNRDVTINWLSMIYMLAYIPFIIPAMWYLEHNGLKKSSVIACFLNALGAWLKCFSVSLDGKRFPILLAGQTLCALSQIFILGIPAHLAAVWFGANEVSRATSFGVFGNQIGIAFGFVIPPLFIPIPSMNTTMGMYKEMFNFMFYSGAIVTTLIFIVVCVVFDAKPPTAPSKGQQFIQKQSIPVNYIKSLRALASNVNFILLVITYGINTGCFYGISTNLNSFLLRYFEEGRHSGWAGFLMIFSGIVASVCIGIVLDKTKSFRFCVISVYIFSTLSMGAFTGGLYLYSWPLVFVNMIFLGFFMTGYLPLGFEIAAEMTYPQNEGLTSGILNLSAQVFGISFTYLGTFLLDNFGPLAGNICILSFLILGAVLTIIMKIDLKRQKAHFVGDEIEVISGNITK